MAPADVLTSVALSTPHASCSGILACTRKELGGQFSPKDVDVTPHWMVVFSQVSSVPEQPEAGPKFALKESEGQCGAVHGLHLVLFLAEHGADA